MHVILDSVLYVIHVFAHVESKNNLNGIVEGMCIHEIEAILFKICIDIQLYRTRSIYLYKTI